MCMCVCIYIYICVYVCCMYLCAAYVLHAYYIYIKLFHSYLFLTSYINLPSKPSTFSNVVTRLKQTEGKYSSLNTSSTASEL